MKSFERFKQGKVQTLRECLLGNIGEGNSPDIPTVGSAESLKEQYCWYKYGISNSPEKDAIAWEGHEEELRAYVDEIEKENIDWEALEKELRAYADEVAAEWQHRKREQKRREAIRSERLNN